MVDIRNSRPLFTIAVLIGLFYLPAVQASASQALRIGFSRSVVGQVNENDAVAMIRIWAKELADREKLSVDPQPQIFSGTADMETALRSKQVECVIMTAPEFFDLQPLMDKEQFIIALKSGKIFEEYLLAVHKQSHISKLTDLEGKTLVVSDHFSSNLSLMWLDLELDRNGLTTAKQFFKRVRGVKKISDAVLPVFFKKETACLVPRTGFDTMAELNPQISAKLNTLAFSPKVVPTFFAFRGDYHSDVKQVILERIAQWDQTPSGRQILNIFQMDALRLYSYQKIVATLELIDRHRNLLTSETTTTGVE